MAVNKAHREFHTLDMNSGWETPEGYPPGVQQKILSGALDEKQGNGTRTRLLRFAPGTYTVAGRCRNLWDEYLAFTEKMETPPERRYQQIHLGHCAFLPPEERRFITEDLIRATGGLVGTPDEIVAMLREREAMGLGEITLLPAMAEARRNLRDFAEQVIARY